MLYDIFDIYSRILSQNPTTESRDFVYIVSRQTHLSKTRFVKGNMCPTSVTSMASNEINLTEINTNHCVTHVLLRVVNDTTTYHFSRVVGVV